jgi:hypothetical protein
MSFSRTTPPLPQGGALDASLRGIGMRLGTRTRTSIPADIELTLVSVAMRSLPNDYRALGVLVAWLEVHHARINVPRLLRIVREAAKTPLENAWWATIGSWLVREDSRWRPMMRVYAGPKLDLDDPEVTELQLSRVGPDQRFTDAPLRIHARLIRSRAADVDEPIQLAARHPLYMRRVQLGASYRADVWAALDQDPDATPAAIARRVGCAYETARSVARDWSTARAATVLARH